ncbi:MAG: hypothetical protein ACU841_14295 [Gammaproteobacteria bacterium]
MNILTIEHKLFFGAKIIQRAINLEDIIMRLSIEVAPEQHQRLNAVAALRGQSIKDYVLERVLPQTPRRTRERPCVN